MVRLGFGPCNCAGDGHYVGEGWALMVMNILIMVRMMAAVL